MIKIFSALYITMLALVGCSGCAQINPDMIGVGADDNAFQCIKVSLDGYLTDSNASTTRFEAPGTLTISDLSPEQIQALDAMAQRMGC
jgi:hypothetical protein